MLNRLRSSRQKILYSIEAELASGLFDEVMDSIDSREIADVAKKYGAAIASIALGATVIEKHFTLSRAEGGVDSAFSMEPAEMAQLVKECKAAHQALGQISYEPSEQEIKSLRLRRSLYIVENMKAGDIITEKNMRSIRPGLGLSPKYYDEILGLKVLRDVERGTPVSFNLFK